ncbi:hypothetical protein V6N13_043460 [Hibiscus sabdariffa]|uniref:Protein arginine methyltransferase NDUFAF7 n=1 Tax=Hibiscus sabdariffa TaxID=183260 RepID=A0ABR2G1L0_9ROSI
MIDVTEDSLFRFVLSPQPTPATLYLIKRCKWAVPEEVEKLNQIEVCPKAMDLTYTFAKRIGADGDEQAESLRTGYWGLVGDGEAPFWERPAEQAPIGMGTHYMAMSIVNNKQGIPIPVQ